MEPGSRSHPRPAAARAAFGLAVSALITAFGCASPAPVLRLEAVDEIVYDDDWLYGRHLLRVGHEALEVELAYVETAGDRLVFHTQLTNLSEGSLVITPEDLFYEGFTDPSAAAGDTVWALDPERVILGLDQEAHRLSQRQSNAETTDLVVDVIGLVAAVASIGRDDEVEEADEDDYGFEDEQLSRELRDQRYDDAISGLERERAEWTNRALRKTTLFPGESCAGLVEFPARRGISHVRVTVAKAGPPLRFLYRQTEHRAYPRAR